MKKFYHLKFSVILYLKFNKNYLNVSQKKVIILLFKKIQILKKMNKFKIMPKIKSKLILNQIIFNKKTMIKILKEINNKLNLVKKY